MIGATFTAATPTGGRSAGRDRKLKNPLSWFTAGLVVTAVVFVTTGAVAVFATTGAGLEVIAVFAATGAGLEDVALVGVGFTAVVFVTTALALESTAVFGASCRFCVF
jgi:hypothetical protein